MENHNPPINLRQPPPTAQMSITDIIQIRMGLDHLKEPSRDILTAIAHLDAIILNFTSSLKPGA